VFGAPAHQLLERDLLQHEPETRLRSPLEMELLSDEVPLPQMEA
jgi:hypothetical protein